MKEILSKLKEMTGKEFVQLTERGNQSIKIALDLASQLDKKKVLIPDQGGWMTYKKYPKKYGLDIVEVKTDKGILDLEDLKSKADPESILLTCSMQGYFARDNVEEIMKICSGKGCIFVNDVSGSIGTDAAKVGDIIIGSFGKQKPINLEYGGFIATSDAKFYESFDASYFEEGKYDELLKKFEELPSRLAKFQDTRNQVLEDLQSFEIVHKDKEGINIIVKFDDDEVKQRIVDYCNENKLEFTECPRYIRINEPAISIEIKRL